MDTDPRVEAWARFEAQLEWALSDGGFESREGAREYLLAQFDALREAAADAVDDGWRQISEWRWSSARGMHVLTRDECVVEGCAQVFRRSVTPPEPPTILEADDGGRRD